MPHRNIQFVNGEFYHIVKKGVEERKIFLDDEDRLRFINSLLVFNDKNPTPWNMRAFWEQRDPASLLKSYKPKEPFVEVAAFALLDNHFHLLVRQLLDNGIVNFMHKLGGYVYYFNKKYKRVGTLFQGRFMAVLVEDENYLKNIFVYVHTNPLAIIKPNWKSDGIKDFSEAVNFLENYRWSSYQDYLGKENFPNVICRNFFKELFSSENHYKKEVESWIRYKTELPTLLKLE